MRSNFFVVSLEFMFIRRLSLAYVMMVGFFSVKIPSFTGLFLAGREVEANIEIITDKNI